MSKKPPLHMSLTLCSRDYCADLEQAVISKAGVVMMIMMMRKTSTPWW